MSYSYLFYAFIGIVSFNFFMMFRALHTCNIMKIWATGCNTALDSDCSLYIGNPWYWLATRIQRCFGRKVAITSIVVVLSVAAVLMWLVEAAVLASIVSWLF